MGFFWLKKANPVVVGLESRKKFRGVVVVGGGSGGSGGGWV